MCLDMNSACQVMFLKYLLTHAVYYNIQYNILSTPQCRYCFENRVSPNRYKFDRKILQTVVIERKIQIEKCVKKIIKRLA